MKKNENVVSLLSRIGSPDLKRVRTIENMPDFPVNTNVFLGPKSFTRIVMAEMLKDTGHANDHHGLYDDAPYSDPAN